MAKVTAATEHAQPFRSSWINRFNHWVQQLSLPAGVVFLLCAIMLVGGQLLFYWGVGGGPDFALLPVLIFNGLFIPYLLALIYFLDNQAATALASMRPLLNLNPDEFKRVHYMLVNMPGRAALFAGLAMTTMAILIEQQGMTPASYAVLEHLPLFSVLFQIIDKSAAFFFGVFIYHTVRQLRLVNHIYMHHLRINLFHLGLVQGFSRLTAFTALGLIAGVYGWLLINPELLTDPLILGFVGAITLLALAVFILPLYGMHRRMVREKYKLLQDLDRRFEAVFAEFNQGFRDDDFANMERLNGTISSLYIQQKRVEAIPTWPWRSETAQFVLTAITLPLILAILQFLVEQALG